MVKILSTVCAVLVLATASLALGPRSYSFETNQGFATSFETQDIDPSLLYPAYNLSVPIDHFHNDSMYEPHSEGSFNLRYWFDATYYKDGGPVIVLQSGLNSGVGRLAILQKGILHQLAKATHGIGVVLEHRYYGASWPVANLSTQSLRFLTTDQAMADQAYFAKNVVFAGLEEKNLTAPNTAYIAYGGSYAGAFVAFLRKLYPDVFWGAISSSGVTQAIWDYWSYFEPVRVYADQQCIAHQEKVIDIIDNILIGKNDSSVTAMLKGAFGLSGLTHEKDFAKVVSVALDGWQEKNWDPAIDDPKFDMFCFSLTFPEVIWSETEHVKSTVEDLIRIGGHESEVSSLTTPLLNWIGWLNQTSISRCQKTQDECFSTYNATYYAQDDISQDWRPWPYQYCTQWGYLVTGSGVPEDRLPLRSRTMDLEYLSNICRLAFNITTPPDVDAINKFGGFDISYPRLAIVDGERDPWRPATPHASPFNSMARNRTSTASEPFLLIPGGINHWDENGLFPNETSDVPPFYMPPLPVRDAQSQLVEFVLGWMQEWEERFLTSQQLR